MIKIIKYKKATNKNGTVQTIVESEIMFDHDKKYHEYLEEELKRLNMKKYKEAEDDVAGYIKLNMKK